MKIITFAAICLLLTSFAATAALDTTRPSAQDSTGQLAAPNSYLNINVGIDTDGLILAANRITAATQELSLSIQALAQNPNLSPEQQEELHATLNKMGDISVSLNSAIAALPSSIEKSRRPLLNTVDEAASSIVWTFASMGFALLLLLACAFWLLYRFVLFPVQSAIVATSNNLSVLSQSLQQTAVLVDNIQQQQSTTAKDSQNKLLCGEDSSP